MRVTAYGAAREVTGSCHLLEAGGKRILVDCGQFQGGNHSYDRSTEPFPFDPRSIDAVVLTHGHLDHIGRLPLLVKSGFDGPIYATGETREIGRLILMDAAHVMYEEYGWRKRKAARRGEKIPPPPFAVEDALLAVDQFAPPVAYDSPLSLGGALSLTLRNAGHVLGSAFVEFREERRRRVKSIVFSGDLGYRGREVMPDPAACPPCNVVVSEATYGDRPHRPVEESRQEFAGAIKDALGRGGNVVIPSFALERTQDVLYYLHQMWDAGELPTTCHIFLDSPLAISITEAYERHLRDLNPRLVATLDRGEDPFGFPGVEFTPSVEDSRAINLQPSGSIIVAGSGMANGGRILHHLRHNLWRDDCSIIFVGYQAIGTPGRAIVDGAKSIKIMGEEIAVRARVYTINGLSAHADQRGIIDWLRGSDNADVLLVHGEPKSLDALAAAIRDELHRTVTIAEPRIPYEL
jgi:metallo-beta-lactamase family protein